MLFNSPLFLYCFLVVVLAGYFIAPRSWRNGLLLIGSLLFYAWGEQEYVAVLIGSITINYFFGITIDSLEDPRRRRRLLGWAIAVNVALLAAFKYAEFLVGNLNVLLALCRLGAMLPPNVHLPLGISFFTFHALSYLIDIHRREVRALDDPVDFALYISFFPQSIAGPIVRYHDVAAQLTERTHSEEKFASGIRQFLYGLAKKMLIANVVAVPADAIFGLPAAALTCGLAWLGAICYTLQIYFDFSGYSDMAIGLARMFGFEFKANFNYPYIARSVTEFWRRWHISLSSWFRDYLYIPLGGNRGGALATYRNLVTVFFLCGLWHGASWTFVVWGLYHGAFLGVERIGLGKRIERWPAPLRHGYLLLVVIVGWVFFRAATFDDAVTILSAMAGLGDGTAVEYYPATYLQNDVVLALAAGVIFAMPVLPWLRRLRHAQLGRRPQHAEAIDAFWGLASAVVLGVLGLASCMLLAGGTYNPFIYYRF
jgi:alginate O-acetyltransferase complex protein AlgI